MNSNAPTSAAAPATAPDPTIHDFVADKMFPCVGAKSALNKGRLHTQSFGRLADPSHTEALYRRLLDFSAQYPDPGNLPVSFVAMFDPETDGAAGEQGFEQALWRQLQQLHEHDVAQGAAWAEGVSDNPEREDFSFSVGGRAFFVVGLHPGASRLARRTPVPSLVFNFHQQFEHLKATGKYTVMQDAIRARDVALQGSINPVLARFGESSEARQYSGRAVEAGWKCPFHSKAPEHA
ncbi:guanitoxin biosynthesis heme-dependent pre-guanitoxin N-hydroxylase GntA [Acidovorax sp. FG27]|uniref:guanitoxin biosynthesis heme-dependent pre-guanitoxin N-hydroxylase GntA n=1 Tax=Acidovorax sp. FG27 TaxID=3133652 RepID=UPI0030E9B894